MAYDKRIEQRIDSHIAQWNNIEKKKMFGGVCYLAHGNMCFGIWRDNLIVRTDVSTAQSCLQREHVRPFDATGRPMKGWLMIAEPAFAQQGSLEEWLAIGHDFACSLPEK